LAFIKAGKDKIKKPRYCGIFMQLVSVKYFLNLNRYNSSKGKAIGVWTANIGENGLLKKIFLLIYFLAI